MFNGYNLTLNLDVDQTHSCLVHMIDPLLTNALFPSINKSRYKNEINKYKDSTLHKTEY